MLDISQFGYPLDVRNQIAYLQLFFDYFAHQRSIHNYRIIHLEV